MRLGEVANAAAAVNGTPLEGVRVLALEQMQALPFATQLLARLGADVVKVEHPVHGESGRGSQPAMIDPEGRSVGATYLRNNLGKRSVGIDLKADAGRELVLALAPHFDIVCENFTPGTAGRLGLDYDAVRAVHPGVIYLSVSGFGNLADSPYKAWPAYAPVVEAMSGIYDYTWAGERPRPVPMGAVGDIGAAMFGVVGVLAALRMRDRTGEGQYVDISMLDAMVAITDLVTNYWSMGVRPEPGARPSHIIEAFRAGDGWFVVQVVREHQFDRLAEAVGHPEWIDDPRFADRSGWVEHLDTVIRPAVEAWAQGFTKHEAAEMLTKGGVASGPCNTAADVIDDPHVAVRHMLVEIPRVDGVDEPILTPGNPVKMSAVAEGPETRMPWVGEHTEAVLRDELGLGDDDLEALRAAGTITSPASLK